MEAKVPTTVGEWWRNERLADGGAFLMLLLLAVPGWRTLGDPRFFHTQDGFEHAFRLLSIETAVRHGDLLPRWVPLLAGGFGYPIFAVYSPLAYYPPLLLTLAGVAIFPAIKITLALLLFASGLGAYLAVRGRAGRLPGLVAAACYACAPYTLVNAYIRADMAELSTFPLTALTAAALLRLGDRMKQGRATAVWAAWPSVVLAALPLALIPATHSLSLVNTMPTILSLLALCVIDDWRRRGTPWPAVAIAAVTSVLAAALAAWFLLPAWEWQSWLRIGTIPEDEHFFPKLLHLPALVAAWPRLTPWGWLGKGSVWWCLSIAPGPIGELPVSPAYVAMAAALGAVVLALRNRRANRGAVAAVAIATLATAFFTTAWSAPFWHAVPRLTLLQFPWRLMGPLTLDIALLAGFGIAGLPGRWRAVAGGAVIAAMLLPAVVLTRPAPLPFGSDAVTWPEQWRRELTGGIGTTGNGLFLPRWTTTTVPGLGAPGMATERQSPSGLHVTSVRIDGRAITLQYLAAGAVTMTIARLYAPPWTAWIDGQSATLSPQLETGLQQIVLPPGTHQLRIVRRPTPAGVLGGAVSLGAAAVVIFGLLAPIAKRRAKRNDGNWHGMHRLTLGALVAVSMAGIGGLLLGHHEQNGTWTRPVGQPAPTSSGRIVAWRPEQSPVWGRLPVVQVALLTRRRVGHDDDLVVRLIDRRGKVVGERRQRPRLGMYRTTGWPAALLVDDHLLLPGPTSACGGPFRVEVGLAPHGSSGEPLFQMLGQVVGSGSKSGYPAAQRACTPIAPVSAAEPAAIVSGYRVVGATGGPIPKVRPSGDVVVDVQMRTNRPTTGDDGIIVQLIDVGGHVVAQQRSSGKDDLIFSSLWRAGGTITYRSRLRLPAHAPKGFTRIAVGLYSDARKGYRPIQTDVVGGPVAEPAEVGPLVLLAGGGRRPGPPIATFGTIIGMQAVRVTGEREGAIAAGGNLGVSLHWRLLAPAVQSYTVSVQLLDRLDHLVAQSDSLPVNGRYPTTLWSVGETVVDDHLVAVPRDLPPGSYRLVVSWYLLSSGARLPVAPAETANAQPLATVRVIAP